MKSTEFHPWRDNLIVKPDEVGETMSSGGIIVLEKKAPPAKFGTVVAVGPGLAEGSGPAHSVGVKVGDRVAYPTFFGHEMKFDDGVFRCLSERECLGGSAPAVASAPLQPTKRVTVAIEEETTAFPVDDRN